MITKQLIKRIIKFGIVGTSGIAVNSFFLWLGHDIVGLSIFMASPVAIAFAIFSNFNLNDVWTWSESRSERMHNYGHRLWRYYVSASLGAAINYLILLSLTKIWGVYYLIANLFGILAGMTTNFLLSELWVFRRDNRESGDVPADDF